MVDPAIIVNNISKDFRLPHEKATTLKSHFTNFIRARKSRTTEHQHALRNISFEVEKGDFFGIVGRNGSGKSTLLKLLANIYQPTDGTLEVRGRLVPFIELGVGFNPELTGRENVYLNGALLNFSKTEVDDMYDAIVEFAELKKFMDQKLKNYSSGMQVRLAFSMAIRAKADILLVDEVLAVGDADFQRKCFEYFRELKRTKTTVVFVTHDMNAVREYCDKAILIDDSRLVKNGSPDEVAKLYAKLFMKAEEKQDMVEGKKQYRVGDQEVSIVSANPDKSIYQAAKDNSICLRVELKANRDIASNIAVGFLIKNAANVPILGTNTHELHYKLGKMKQGESIKINWQFPNIFSDGKYLIDTAVTSTDGTINHDWWEAAATFRVYREERSPYLITPTIYADIERG